MTRLRTGLTAAALLLPLLALPSSAAAASCAPAKHAGGEWRSYGHDQQNTRTQPAEKVHTGASSAASLGPIAFSAGWVRVFCASWP